MANRQNICTACGCVGSPTRVTKGSFFVEIFLWLLACLPGLIYTIWRLASKYDACPKCGNATMIPIDTPMGQRLLAQWTQPAPGGQ
jgi:hypothetical protein